MQLKKKSELWRLHWVKITSQASVCCEPSPGFLSIPHYICIAFLFHFPPGDYTFQSPFSSVTKPSSITLECPPETEENWSSAKKVNAKVLIFFARTISEVVFKGLILKIYLGAQFLYLFGFFIFLIRPNRLSWPRCLSSLSMNLLPIIQLCQPPHSFSQKHLI